MPYYAHSYDPWRQYDSFYYSLQLSETATFHSKLALHQRTYNPAADHRLLLGIPPALVQRFKDMGVDVQSALEQDLRTPLFRNHKCNLDFFRDTKGVGYVNLVLYGQPSDLKSCVDGLVAPWFKAVAAKAALPTLADTPVNDATGSRANTNTEAMLQTMNEQITNLVFSVLGDPMQPPPPLPVGGQLTSATSPSLVSAGEEKEPRDALVQASAMVAPLSIKNEQDCNKNHGAKSTVTALADSKAAEAAAILAHMRADDGVKTVVPAGADDAIAAQPDAADAANKLKDVEPAKSTTPDLQRFAEKMAAKAATVAQEIAHKAACLAGKRKRE